MLLVWRCRCNGIVRGMGAWASLGNSSEGVLIMAENLVDLHEGVARLRLRLLFPLPSILIQATSLQEVLNAPLCWPFSSRYYQCFYCIATVLLYCWRLHFGEEADDLLYIDKNDDPLVRSKKELFTACIHLLSLH